MTADHGLAPTPPNAVRREEYAMGDEWIREFLGQAMVGHIATSWEQQPFLTAINFVYEPNAHQILFHTHRSGRLRTNLERNPRACFETSQHGRLLPSKRASGFGMQYASVVAFGGVQVIGDPSEQRRALYALIAHCFPGLEPGVDYQAISEQELARTSVFAMPIESWSGKRNWKE